MRCPALFKAEGDRHVLAAEAARVFCSFAIGDTANVATSLPGFDTLARVAGFALRDA